MEVGLISLAITQLARVTCFVRRVEPVQLGSHEWVLLVRGRGFTRILERELLVAPNLIRPVGWSTPRPMTFPTEHDALTYGQTVGLIARKTTWSVAAAR